LAGTLSVRAQTVQPRPLRVLPLGDSITAGIVDGGRPGTGGYRALLERLLEAHGGKAVLVGSRDDLSAGLSDPWHDGWPGYVIRSTSPGAPGQIYGSLAKRIIEQTHPDIILLMLGTNDFLRYEATGGSYSVDKMVHSMDLLLAEIYSVAPHVHVILGAIVNSPKVDACYVERFDTGRSTCDRRLHPSLSGLAQQYAARGYAITYAGELYGAVRRDREHFPDGIHPVNGPHGYGAIARVWFGAIEDSLRADERVASTRRRQH
jgi:lysophospholipase L1-like esterase